MIKQTFQVVSSPKCWTEIFSDGQNYSAMSFVDNFKVKMLIFKQVEIQIIENVPYQANVIVLQLLNIFSPFIIILIKLSMGSDQDNLQ